MTGKADAYYQRIRPLNFKNESGEVIPPFSVMRITGQTVVNSRLAYTVSKPNTTFQRRHLVNGPAAVPVGGYGAANDGRFVDVEIDYTTAVTNYGPQPSSWECHANRYGFDLIAAPGASGVARAVQKTINQILIRPNGSAILAGSTGSATVYVDQSTAGPWDPITVTNLWEEIPLGTTTPAVWANGKWYTWYTAGAGSSSSSWAIIKVTAVSGSSCAETTANAECIHTAKLQVVNTAGADMCDPFTDDADIFAFAVSECSATIYKDERYVAVKVGTFTSALLSSTRDLYAIIASTSTGGGGGDTFCELISAEADAYTPTLNTAYNYVPIVYHDGASWQCQFLQIQQLCEC